MTFHNREARSFPESLFPEALTILPARARWGSRRLPAQRRGCRRVRYVAPRGLGLNAGAIARRHCHAELLEGHGRGSLNRSAAASTTSCSLKTRPDRIPPPPGRPSSDSSGPTRSSPRRHRPHAAAVNRRPHGAASLGSDLVLTMFHRGVAVAEGPRPRAGDGRGRRRLARLEAPRRCLIPQRSWRGREEAFMSPGLLEIIRVA